MNFKIIALYGKAQSGKSTSSSILETILSDNKNNKIERVSFAKKLKDIAYDLFKWNGDKEIYWPNINNDIVTDNATLILPIPDKGRQLLINIGKKMREIKPTVWADFVKDYIEKYILYMEACQKEKVRLNEVPIFVIDDLRFKNEIDVLKTFGDNLVLIKITRDKVLNIDDISEKDLNSFTDWKHVIDNNGSIEELEFQIKNIIRKENL